jgi:AcrR family transcriptional regulator
LDETSRKLILAGIELFAEHGYDKTSVRDLANRASVNVAAVNYHFGDKETLYCEVLRFCMRKMKSHSDEFRSVTDTALQDGSKEALIHAFRELIRLELETFFDPDTDMCGVSLVMRELNQPSKFLGVIVDEFIRPRAKAMEDLLVRLCPDKTHDEQWLIGASVFGQMLYYRYCLPVHLHLRQREFDPAEVQSIAKHIADFSLRGMGCV